MVKNTTDEEFFHKINLTFKKIFDNFIKNLNNNNIQNFQSINLKDLYQETQIQTYRQNTDLTNKLYFTLDAIINYKLLGFAAAIDYIKYLLAVKKEKFNIKGSILVIDLDVQQIDLCQDLNLITEDFKIGFDKKYFQKCIDMCEKDNFSELEIDSCVIENNALYIKNNVPELLVQNLIKIEMFAYLAQINYSIENNVFNISQMDLYLMIREIILDIYQNKTLLDLNKDENFDKLTQDCLIKIKCNVELYRNNKHVEENFIKELIQNNLFLCKEIEQNNTFIFKDMNSIRGSSWKNNDLYRNKNNLPLDYKFNPNTNIDIRELELLNNILDTYLKPD